MHATRRRCLPFRVRPHFFSLGSVNADRIRCLFHFRAFDGVPSWMGRALFPPMLIAGSCSGEKRGGSRGPLPLCSSVRLSGQWTCLAFLSSEGRRGGRAYSVMCAISLVLGRAHCMGLTRNCPTAFADPGSSSASSSRRGWCAHSQHRTIHVPVQSRFSIKAMFHLGGPSYSRVFRGCDWPTAGPRVVFHVFPIPEGRLRCFQVLATAVGNSRRNGIWELLFWHSPSPLH